jgi:8-oxo-dGTP pyrophosphatase MutT (NUDIX family)
MFSRTNMAGHITASGFVMTPDRSETLLICHKGLNRWLQPGGHVDVDDAEIWYAARREIREETGLTDFALHPWHAEHQLEPAGEGRGRALHITAACTCSLRQRPP